MEMYILIVSDLAKNDKLLNVDRQVKYLDNYYNFSGQLCLFEDGLSYFVTVNITRITIKDPRIYPCLLVFAELEKKRVSCKIS